MEYLPKNIHEKHQQFHYYKLLNDFTSGSPDFNLQDLINESDIHS